MISARILYSLSLLYLCFFSEQSQWLSIICPAALAVVSFVYLYQSLDEPKQIKHFIFFVLALKFISLFAFPNLSDDIYRFKWDGVLVSNGINPYINTPDEIIKSYSGEFKTELTTLYPYLNSKPYHTVYPLISQFAFGLCSKMAGSNLYAFNILLKCIYLVADLILLYFLFNLLIKTGYPQKRILLFYANPLCFVELNGNLHFELFLILFLCIAISNYNKSKLFRSGFNLGLSVISKLNSFLFAPLFLSKSNFIQKNFLLTLGFIIPLTAAAWFIFPGIAGYKSSLGLYFHQFEFNSLLYRHLTEYCDSNKLYDAKKLVGFYLMLCFLVVAFYLFIKGYFNKHSNFSFQTAWYLIFTYLLLSSTVHPWYLTTLVFLSCFYLPLTGYTWSFLVFCSYARYDLTVEPYESFLVTMEYIFVFIVLLLELNKMKIHNA